MALKEEKIIRLATSTRDDGEVSLYIKGFLARGETADHFGAWLGSHRELVAKLGWGPRVYGYGWLSGDIESIPVPIASTVAAVWTFQRRIRNARRFSAFGAAGLVAAEEISHVVGRFIYQYSLASNAAEHRAEILAERLRKLRSRYRYLRVVAHSLGCRHLIEAVSLLNEPRRPDEIHLCAPACRESDVADKLPRLARDATFLYYSGSDAVLELGFRSLSRGPALGAAGPVQRYEGLEAVDVSRDFGFWVHREYKNRFSRFARSL